MKPSDEYSSIAAKHTHSNKIIRFQVYDYDGNLTVRIDESSIGKYICRASVKGFREISASAEVLMKGNSFLTLWTEFTRT